jgi:uncharacterized protein
MMTAPTGTVPCNGCTACCRAELIILHPEDGDRPEDYDCTEIKHPFTGQPAFALNRKPGVAECIYLGPDGCTIHDRAPVLCRKFDCRGFFLKFSRAERRQMMKQDPSVGEMFNAGRERLHTLKAPP